MNFKAYLFKSLRNCPCPITCEMTFISKVAFFVNYLNQQVLKTLAQAHLLQVFSILWMNG